MTVKLSRREHERNPVPTGTLVTREGRYPAGTNHVHRLAVNEFIPMIKKRVKAVLDANPRPVFFYQKLPTGVRCSCWGLGDTPQAFCASCLGSGWVGGYEKYGTTQHILDATSNLQLVNVVPNRKLGLAPLPLSLIDKALRGSIEWVVPLHANVGILDCWRVYQSAPTNTSVTLLVKTPAETEWTAATTESVQARLNAGVLRVRVELTRQSLDDPKPYLRAIRLRYQQLAGDIHVRVNAPLGDAALSMHEFGIVETFTALSFIFDDTLPLISPLDWIYDERTGNKWIIQSVQRHDPYGHLIYSHTQTRLLQNFDCQWEYPV